MIDIKTLPENYKRNMQHEGNDDINCNLLTWKNLKRIDKGTKIFKNQSSGKENEGIYFVLKGICFLEKMILEYFSTFTKKYYLR